MATFIVYRNRKTDAFMWKQEMLQDLEERNIPFEDWNRYYVESEVDLETGDEDPEED